MSTGTVVVAAAAVTGLWVLPIPVGPDPGALAGTGWWEQAGAVVSLYGLARWVLLLFFASVVLVGLARAVIRVGRLGPAVSRRLGSAGRQFGARRILRLLLGLSATGGAVAGCGRVALPAPVLSAPAAPEPPPTAAVAPGPPPTASAPPSLSPDRSPGPPAGAAPARPSERSTSAAPVVWTIRPGDNLWSIAAAVTGSADQASTATYWARLIETNRSRLPYPDDPNLVFTGDQIVLPPLPGGAPVRLP
jgi:nucleoid-associated protein YgaU